MNKRYYDTTDVDAATAIIHATGVEPDLVDDRLNDLVMFRFPSTKPVLDAVQDFGSMNDARRVLIIRRALYGKMRRSRRWS